VTPGGAPSGERAGDLATHPAGERFRLSDAVFRLRVEEALALVFLVPTTYLTVVANLYAWHRRIAGDRHPGGIVRLAVACVLLGALALAVRRWPAAAWVKGLREALPFLICVLIYTNLHDTIGFVNTHDVHYLLIGLDRALFGVEPCVWAERFITPGRTDLMQFLYLSFFWIAPSTSLILLAHRRLPEFRRTTLGIVVCFYLGYVLYLIFPAAPPRLVLVYQFRRSLYGYPSLFSNLSADAFSLLPVDSRAAFPSLHAAVSLLALVYAWRYLRPWFLLLVPFVAGLWVSTIYLRHHYAVDLVAGWMLVPAALWAAPRLDRWWARRQRARGYPTALGAEGA
jgi:membrane-associated phospholipid phosphatase